MKLLRDFVLLGRLRRLAAARRSAGQHAYTITVPAPLATDGGNVVALRRSLNDGAAIRRVVSNVAPALPLLARAANQ